MSRRFLILLPGYLAIFTICFALAFELRFEFEVPAEYRSTLRDWLALALGLKILVALVVGDWRRSFRYTSVADAICLVSTVSVSSVFIYVLGLVQIMPDPVPRSIVAIDWSLCLIAFGAIRVGMCYYTDLLRHGWGGRSAVGKRAIIFGTGESSVAIQQALRSAPSGFRVVAFVEESGRCSQPRLNGTPVHATTESSWEDLVTRLRVRHILIPGSVPGVVVRRLIEECSEIDTSVHVIPEVRQLVSGRYRIAMRDVTINDLLQREPNDLDLDSIREFIEGRRVLVTGAAGSIGSELCRQILSLGPRTLTLVDQSELGMFEIEAELVSTKTTSTGLEFIVGDILDQPAMQRLFARQRPEVVFHAAAYKHVPLMERNPGEAIRNNIFGTQAVIDLAREFQVGRFVLISSDKAVQPTSVMGATKLVAEKCLQAATLGSRTQFMTVRFGNVLNSSGSVVSVFRNQIEAGRPITVTHPDMERFFLTIPEAVQLVLQAVAIGNTGDLMVLDMGEPVKIVELAKSMILLSGLHYPEDIDIVFTGMRPGEKLTEELYYDSEFLSREEHGKVTRVRTEMASPRRVQEVLEELRQVLTAESSECARVLWEAVRMLNQHDAADADDEQKTIPFPRPHAA